MFIIVLYNLHKAFFAVHSFRKVTACNLPLWDILVLNFYISIHTYISLVDAHWFLSFKLKLISRLSMDHQCTLSPTTTTVMAKEVRVTCTLRSMTQPKWSHDQKLHHVSISASPHQTYLKSFYSFQHFFSNFKIFDNYK